MLGEEIQTLSISNLNVPASRCRYTGKWSEATNARIETTSAKSLMSRSRRGISRISSPPTAGMKVTNERMMGLRLSIFIEIRLVVNSHPDHVGNHHRAPGGNPSGVGSQVARLHVARRVRCLARCVRRFVDSGVDHSLVDAMPKNRSRAVDQRFDKKGGINFVDVIFVQNGRV